MSFVQTLDSKGRGALRAFDYKDQKGLVNLLVELFPLAYGDDYQYLNGLRFPFYKRALLVALELHGRALSTEGNESIPLPMVDIDLVGPVADYEIPRSLRGFGIVEFEETLKERINSWQEIMKDSQEEIEIRASLVVSTCYLLQEINRLRKIHRLPMINMAHLDYWLWSQAGNIAGSINPHRTTTMAY